ncbi:uncharacterized protein BDR25DRAFT_314217 [Lindgomyces ingoldianus]|uniref:Uncharacterized protein n=1 Tax=Lindgomyces ingoldianus TaxID=673940 RepID=A0ACB6QW10_9PLEO|nr:uncharacterized protein BDR25DRAFT_314217 [Lindgomyces ingoldianus]KAF2471060.1 hypothetical protein BDR25DRAFT_314217 [Lindgomyces ingoldianus]
MTGLCDWPPRRDESGMRDTGHAGAAVWICGWICVWPGEGAGSSPSNARPNLACAQCRVLFERQTHCICRCLNKLQSAVHSLHTATHYRTSFNSRNSQYETRPSSVQLAPHASGYWYMIRYRDDDPFLAFSSISRLVAIKFAQKEWPCRTVISIV